MIRWRLRVVMADRGITNEELAEKLNIHRVTVSNMKNAKQMPHIGGERLNSLCKVLNCSPWDLIEYIPDAE